MFDLDSGSRRSLSWLPLGVAALLLAVVSPWLIQSIAERFGKTVAGLAPGMLLTLASGIYYLFASQKRVPTIDVKAIVNEIEQVEPPENGFEGLWSMKVTFQEPGNQKVHSVRFHDEVAYEPGEEALVAYEPGSPELARPAHEWNTDHGACGLGCLSIIVLLGGWIVSKFF